MAYDPLNDGNVSVVVLKNPTTGALYAAAGGGGGGGDASAANQLAVQGPVAPGAATATAAVLGGGQYNAGGVTLASGQQAGLQMDATGALRVSPNTGAVTQSGTWTVQPGNTANITPWLVSAAGPVASGAADSGNPMKVGARYNATIPGFTDGNRGDLQITQNGSLNVMQHTYSASGADGSSNTLGWVIGDGTSHSNARLFAGATFVYNGSTWDRQRGDTNGAYAVGNIAHDGADSGNPLKVGGVYKSSGTAVASGDRTDFLTDAKGNQGGFIVAAGADPASCVAVGNNHADATSNGTQRLAVANFPMKFNGASWDRDARPWGISRIASAAASVNASLAKSSAGAIAWVMGQNKAAYDIHLKLYNKASSPTVGTDTVALSVPLPAGAAFFLPIGVYLGTGIAYGLTQGAGDSDTTALAAGDIVSFSLGYS